MRTEYEYVKEWDAKTDEPGKNHPNRGYIDLSRDEHVWMRLPKNFAEAVKPKVVAGPRGQAYEARRSAASGERRGATKSRREAEDEAKMMRVKINKKKELIGEDTAKKNLERKQDLYVWLNEAELWVGFIDGDLTWHKKKSVKYKLADAKFYVRTVELAEGQGGGGTRTE